MDETQAVVTRAPEYVDNTLKSQPKLSKNHNH